MSSQSSDAPQSEQVLHDLDLLMRQELFYRDQDPGFHRTDVTDYAYYSLPNKFVIRLLVLHPGTGDEALHGSIGYASIKHPRDYDALSYAWGSPEKPYRIRLNNSTATLPITESLYVALRRLRSTVTARTLWVDAICINQTDNAEKSVQVAIMNEIYSSAQRVLCWLGEESSACDGSQTLHLLQDLARVHFRRLKGTQVTDEFMQSLGLPKRLDSRWFAAHQFFQRSWFQRGWVIQEVVLGRKLVMLCGNTELKPWTTAYYGAEALSAYNLIPWGMSRDGRSAPGYNVDGLSTFRAIMSIKAAETFASEFHDRCRFYTNVSDGFLEEALNSGELNGQPVLVDIVKRLRIQLSATDLTLNLVSDHTTAGTQLLEEFEMENRRATRSVAVLMQHFTNTLTSDPRDKFFALLNISAEKDEPSLRADYAESLESTCIRYARYYFQKPPPERGPVLLENRLIFAGSAFARLPALPSWVADHDPEPAHWILFGGVFSNYIFQAAGESKTQYQLTDNERELVGKGSIVDKVSRVVTLPNVSDTALEGDVISKFFREMDRMILHRTSPYPRLAPGETHLDVQWRTLIAGTDMNGRIAGDSYRKYYTHDRQQLERLGHLVTLPGFQKKEYTQFVLGLGEWARRWMLLAGNFSICETETGLVGVVPNSTRVGDSLCVFLGEPLPFVIRPVESGNTRHQLVGGCYIHGIMHGEAMQSDNWKERKICLV